MSSQVTITAVRKFPAGDLSRAGKTDTVVFYLVDGTRQGRVTLPKEDPTETDILNAIRQAEKTVSPMLGKSFPL